MNNISIKLMQLQDIADIAPLFDAYRQFYQQAPDLELATNFLKSRFMDKESIILMAESHDQKIVGFCQLYPSFCSVIAKPIYILSDLFVSSDMRKLGIGKMLLEAAHLQAIINKVTRLDLTTAKDNIAAQALYKSMDWVRDEIFYTYNKTLRG